MHSKEAPEQSNIPTINCIPHEEEGGARLGGSSAASTRRRVTKSPSFRQSTHFHVVREVETLSCPTNLQKKRKRKKREVTPQVG
jgi:hypothetical protein